MGAIRVQPNGQSVYLSVTNAAGAAAPLFSDAALTTTVTQPALATSTSTYYLRDGHNVVTLRHSDGTVVLSEAITSTSMNAVDIQPNISNAAIAADVSRMTSGGIVPSGYYAYTSSSFASATSASHGTGTFRAMPWFVGGSVTIDRIGAEVTTIGDVGSKVRLGIYASGSNGLPAGAPVLDGGQIAGDSATVQELTVSVTLAPGLYWIGGVVQSVTTTQPTVRTVGAAAVPVTGGSIVGTSIPTAGQNVIGVAFTGQTGALSAPSSVTSSSANPIRVFVRAA